MNRTPTILIVILAVIAVVVGIYFYISRENMTCELIANSDYIRKNFRSMMDSPQIVRPQNRMRSLMRSGSGTGNYILLAMTFSNPIASNFSVDIMGDNNVVNHKSTSVTQDINGSLILFEVDRVDFKKMKNLRLNNFDSNQNRVTRVVFGKYVNGEMTLEPVSKCFVQYEANTRSTSVVPVLSSGIQNIKMLAKKSGKIGQIVVRGDLNADITSANVSSSGVSDLNNLLDGTNSRTQATISANGFITLNSLRQGRQQLTYVDEIILRNVSGLFPLIITFNYGKYIFDLVYNPNISLDVYNIKADNMSPIYDYDINALRISFNSILTGSSPIPTPTPEPTPIVRTCDKTSYTVTNAPSCENINGVWMRRQLIDYQDTLCQDETKYVDCPANMIPQPTPEPQPPTPQPSVCPIDAVGLSNLRNTINNLESMMRQKDTTISDLRNKLSSQTCPPCPAQQSCPVTQEQYDQAISQFNMIQDRLQEKITEFNTLQDNLRNNYISRETYNQHATQCAREIETLKTQLRECESKINNTLPPQPTPPVPTPPQPTPLKSVYLDGFINLINNLGSNSNVDDLINYLKTFYNEELSRNSLIYIEYRRDTQEDFGPTLQGELFINSRCTVDEGPKYSLCNYQQRFSLMPGYLQPYSQELIDNKFSELFKIICLIGYAYSIYKVKGFKVLSLYPDIDNFGFALFILSLRYQYWPGLVFFDNNEFTSCSNMFEYLFIRKRIDLWKKAITHMTTYNQNNEMVKNFYEQFRAQGFNLLKLIYGSYISPVPTVDELLSGIPDNIYFVSLLTGGENSEGLIASIENVRNTIINDSFVIHYCNEKFSKYNDVGYKYAYIFGIVRNDNYNNDLESRIKNINNLVAYKVEECYNKNYVSMYGMNNIKQKIIVNVNNFAVDNTNYNYTQLANNDIKLTAQYYINELIELMTQLTSLSDSNIV